MHRAAFPLLTLTLVAGAGVAAVTLRTPKKAPAAVVAAAPTSADRTAELARVSLIASKHPTNAALALEAGGLAGDLGHYERALTWFERAANLDPKLIPAVTGQGQMWMALGRPGLAAKKYEQALKLAPREPQLLLEVSRAYTELRVFREALRYAGEAEKLAPHNPQVYRAFATIYTELLENDLARERAERACKLAPDDPENWALFGGVLLRQAQYVEAERAAKRVLGLAPAHVAGNLLYARALIDGKKTPDAERLAFAALARARVVEPFNPQALLLQGQILSRSGELPLAISLLRQARVNAPRDSAVLLALGQALVRSGKSQEGVRLTAQAQKLGVRGVPFLDLENLVEKNPAPALVARLADLYLRQEMYDSAIYVLERGIRRAPADESLSRKLAVVRAAAERTSALAGKHRKGEGGRSQERPPSCCNIRRVYGLATRTRWSSAWRSPGCSAWHSAGKTGGPALLLHHAVVFFGALAAGRDPLGRRLGDVLLLGAAAGADPEQADEGEQRESAQPD